MLDLVASIFDWPNGQKTVSGKTSSEDTIQRLFTELLVPGLVWMIIEYNGIDCLHTNICIKLC